MKKLAIILTAIVFTVFTNNSNAQTNNKDIVDVAASVDDFSTLVTAVKAAGLVDALKGDGPFTVFAPTNSAFAKIDAETLNSLLKPENKSKLAALLTYHVVSGKFLAADVVKGFEDSLTVELKTLNGGILKLRRGKGGIYIRDEQGNYSKITSTDVMASNGVIHIINKVVMPK